jgi:hypothetical protein
VRVRSVDRYTLALQSGLPAGRQNCVDDAENSLLFGMGRLQPLVCDICSFSLWLKLCENRHDHAAEAQFPPLMCDMRLIDLREHCLVTIRVAVAVPRNIAFIILGAFTV